MPVISMFYGVIVQMYYVDDKQHHLPHIHAKYQADSASLAIESGEVLAGRLRPRQIRLVQAWIEIHREDLLADWELAVNGQQVFPIEPLR